MSSNLRTYLHACYGLDAVIQRVPADRWSNASPCEDWTAAEIVGHVMISHNHILTMLGSGTDMAGTTEADAAGADPRLAWTQLFSSLRSALDAQGALQAVGPTPFGEMSVDQFVGAIAIDPLAHTWDLASATGLPAVLDEGLAAHGVAQLEVVGDLVRGAGLFGPASEVASDASVADQFLASSGRDPRWSADSPDDAHWRADAQAWIAADSHAQRLGVELVSASEDEVVVALEVTDEHCNSVGALHGGVSFSLADVGLSTICNLGGPTAVAIDVHMVFLSGGKPGQRVEARCTTVRRGRSLGTYRCDLVADGKAIGAFTGTVMVTGN